MDNVRMEVYDHKAILTICKPSALNALDSSVLRQIYNTVNIIGETDDIRCLILTGFGEKSFVAGADVSEMQGMNLMEARAFGAYGNMVFRAIEQLPIPVIAAINGYALGGGFELALSCDLRIASENAVFSFPETGLGIIPGFGGTQRLPRIVGMAKAKELIFTGDRIDAAEALRLGLISRIVPQIDLIAEASKLADKINSKAPFAVRNAKTAINRGMQCDLDTALSLETELFAQCFSTEDQAEAMGAFLEKRKNVVFKNK